MTSEIIEFYDRFAESYDDVVFKERDYTAFEVLPQWILEKWQGSACHLLDLGCGTGLGAAPYLKEHKVTGVDISPKMLEMASKHPFYRLVCQSLEDPLPFSGGEFDGAQLLGVMEFIQDPERLFQNICCVLKKNGLFALTVPKKLPAEVEEHLGIRTYIPSAIESIFQRCGFTVIKKEELQGFQSQGQRVDYCAYLLSAI